ncbi:hypothetical protein GJ744_004992 [Endocarpon pusillum]|uniref:Meiotically up-regulated gene 89 protein n=1 Tax=Endocarpon pusillum TaxID=364733 RepID=A0A8H7A8Z5_9EURO|nr:hypothetical protein GJ744_004992 [Endocarpon pusillum]
MLRTEVAHTDSIETEDVKKDQEKKQKSRRPANTAFRQQRLKAWQPILTPKTVLPLFFVVGIIFAPLGGVLLWASAMVQELRIDYTNCTTNATSGGTNSDFSPIPSDKYSSQFRSSTVNNPPQWRQNRTVRKPEYGVEQDTNVCSLRFSIPNDIGPPVLLYYRLTNFYQNHRRYVKSLDTDQLLGRALDNATIADSACDPLTLNNESGKAYYPCGLIANSLFNDTINSPILINAPGIPDGRETYQMTNKGISWSSDNELYKDTSYTRDQVEPPPNWRKRYPDGYTEENDIPKISQYEELQVWMRTAGLPTFSKLALRNDNVAMGAGTYEIEIYDYFPVDLYGGTKSILLSTRTVMGGKNPFLGIAYLVVGGICVVLGVSFTVAHLVKPRKLGDHTYLTWNNDNPTTATATGRDSGPGTIA